MTPAQEAAAALGPLSDEQAAKVAALLALAQQSGKAEGGDRP